MTLVCFDLLLQDGDCVIELSLDLFRDKMKSVKERKDETNIEDFLL